MIISHPIKPKITLAEFLEHPETQPASEYFDGDIEQKSMPQGEHSTLQFELTSAINHLGKAQKLVYALPELRCTFEGRSIVPDIAVFEWERLPRTETGRIANPFELPPDWIIEILSPEQSANKVIKKILFCLTVGTKLGWLIDPKDESIIIFKPNQVPEIKSGQENLPILAKLGTQSLTVATIFNWLNFPED